MKKETGRKISGILTFSIGLFCAIYLLADSSVNSFAEFIFPTGIVCILVMLLGIKILRGRNLFQKPQ
jgi:hypothetical protein